MQKKCEGNITSLDKKALYALREAKNTTLARYGHPYRILYTPIVYPQKQPH